MWNQHESNRGRRKQVTTVIPPFWRWSIKRVRAQFLINIIPEQLAELTEAITYDDSSDSTDSSSDDEDMAILLVHAAFPPSEETSRVRICIDSLSDYECERLFR